MATKVSKLDKFRAKFKAFSATFTGKLVLSATRAFLGVFIAAETQLFNVLEQIVNKQADFGTLKSLVLALGAAAVTAAIRAAQHFLFNEK